MSTKERRPDRGAIEAAGVWATDSVPVAPSVSAVRDALDAADADLLLAALSDNWMEPWALSAEARATCWRCGQRRSVWAFSPVRARCVSCRSSFTRFAIAEQVLADPDAVDRLLALSEAVQE
jgi:hypothetical protein